MTNIKILQEALSAWDAWSANKPELAWVGSDIEFLIKIEERRLAGGALAVSEEERERIYRLGPPRQHAPGPLGGLAIRDVDIGRISQLLCEVAEIAFRLAQELR